jgi:crotonobetainyl-CoA:carnitine CoA-transferase CaiB-like acyl-CoA transferase
LMTDHRTMLANFPALYQLLATEILPSRTTQEWRAVFDGLDIPCAPVYSLDNLIGDPHLKAVKLLEVYDHPTRGSMRQVRNPVVADHVAQKPDHYPPELGQHGPEILRAFGFDEAAINDLVNRGVVGSGARSQP